MRSRRYKLWAGVASVIFHVVVLSVLAVTDFFPGESVDAQSAKARIHAAAINNFLESEPIVTKPKVVRSFSSKPVLEALDLSESQNIMLETAFFEENVDESQQQNVFTDTSLLSEDMPGGQVKFFGSSNRCRRVCYVVDCSGSMQGLWGMVKRELSNSINNLEPDQYFCIVFFGNSKVFSYPQSGLTRASNPVKQKACSFIGNVHPVGKTNSMAALIKAVSVKDTNDKGPEVIFFLTDGFELSRGDTLDFERDVQGLMRRELPSAKVNTIGFWPGENDKKLLQRLARDTRGHFTCIGSEDL